MAGPVDLLSKPRQEAYDKGMELLRTVGLADKALSYPDKLSGDQKQRAAIARTLTRKPEIILFDEPASALAPTMIGEVLSIIRTLARKNLAMMIATHEMKFVRDVSTRVFYTDQGGSTRTGRPSRSLSIHSRSGHSSLSAVKVFEEAITSWGFDFIGVTGRLEEFGWKHMIPQRTISQMQMASGELCVQALLPRLPERICC